jgi:hypothetical protein
MNMEHREAGCDDVNGVQPLQIRVHPRARDRTVRKYEV